MKSKKEVHPYAARRRMLSEPDLRKLADDIKENGLLHPIVTDPQGVILDGRNRYAACEIAGIEPTFETYDGDPLAFVLSSEDRRHSTLPQLAAENALILYDAGKRKDGRWERGSVPEPPDSGRSSNMEGWRGAMKKAGLILDVLGAEALEYVRDGADGAHLDGIYREAREEKSRREKVGDLPKDLRVLVEADDISIEDAMRRAALPDAYGSRVASGDLTLDEAETLLERDERDKIEGIERAVNRIRSFLHGWPSVVRFHENGWSEEILAALDDHEREQFVPIQDKLRRLKWPSEL